jgi:hypothetical protein
LRESVEKMREKIASYTSSSIGFFVRRCDACQRTTSKPSLVGHAAMISGIDRIVRHRHVRLSHDNRTDACAAINLSNAVEVLR